MKAGEIWKSKVDDIYYLYLIESHSNKGVSGFYCDWFVDFDNFRIDLKDRHYQWLSCEKIYSVYYYLRMKESHEGGEPEDIG